MTIEIYWRQIKDWKGPPEFARAPHAFNGAKMGTGYLETRIAAELEARDVLDCVIETDHDRGDRTVAGPPRKGAEGHSSRVQLVFDHAGQVIVMPSWGYHDWQENLKAIQMTLERQRLIAAYGVVSVESQVGIFASLPAGAGIDMPQSPSEIRDAAGAAAVIRHYAGGEPGPIDDYRNVILREQDFRDQEIRAAMMKTHPDQGGSNEEAALVNAAVRMIRKNATT